MSAQTVAIIRGVLMCIAVMFSNGVIPTNVDGGGRKVGDAIMVIAVTRGRPAQRRGPEVMGAGCSQRSVARAFNVTQTRVWQIANRRAWVHV